MRVWQHGLPAFQDHLSAELGQWFDSIFENPPDLRTIEKYVAQWWSLLQLLDVAKCELQPSKEEGAKPSSAPLRRD